MHRSFEEGIHDVIKVRAEFYSSLKQIVDASAFELSLPGNATVSDLLEQLQQSFPKLRDFGKSILCGIDLEFVDRNHQLKDGDIVAIMPPVQGG